MGTQQNTVERLSASVTIVQPGEKITAVPNDTEITLPQPTSGSPPGYDTITNNEESITMFPSEGDTIAADSETAAPAPVNHIAAIDTQVETAVEPAAANNQVETLIDITTSIEQVETSSEETIFNGIPGLVTEPVVAEPVVAEPQVDNPVQTSTKGHLLDTYNGGHISLDTVHPLMRAISIAVSIDQVDDHIPTIEPVDASLSANDDSDIAIVANEMATSDSVGLVESVAILEAEPLVSVLTVSTHELVDTACAVEVDESAATEATVSKEELVHTDEAVVATDEPVAMDEHVIADNGLVVTDNDPVVADVELVAATDEPVVGIENAVITTEESTATAENLIVITTIPNDSAELVHIESITTLSSIEVNEHNQAIAGANISGDSASDADEVNFRSCPWNI